jgi:hypothetical protein
MNHLRARFARLYDLGLREIERERAFGRGSAMDLDWPSIPPLAELSLRDIRRQTYREMRAVARRYVCEGRT